MSPILVAQWGYGTNFYSTLPYWHFATHTNNPNQVVGGVTRNWHPECADDVTYNAAAAAAAAAL